MTENSRISGKSEKTGDKNAEKTIIIKKYANRRLYNTSSGEFVTLETLHQMVQREEIFAVQDAKSGKDLTSSVLTQIIAEEEVKGHNMLPLNTLRQLLKLYSDGIGPQFSNYLEHSIEAFSQNQQKVMQQMTDMLSGNQGIDQWAEMSRRNLELFQNSLNIFNPQMPGENGTVHSETSVAKMDSETDQRPRSETDIDRLRQQMAEMQKQLNALSKD